MEKEVQKLFAKPVEETVNGEKVWIHPLKYPVEAIVCLGRSNETANEMKKGGSEAFDVIGASNLAYVIQELMFVVRKGEAPNAERYFSDSRKVLALGEEAWRLHEVYAQNFEASEAEVGESSRVSS